jgi:hypothetical protein
LTAVEPLSETRRRGTVPVRLDQFRIWPGTPLMVACRCLPTTVVVDATGVIRWIDLHPIYTTRSEVPDILASVNSVR